MTYKTTPLTMLSQQPRWVLLSLFLILWSWSSGFRRDAGRAKALGLGVEAHAHPLEKIWLKRRAVGLPECAQQCALNASSTVGCGDGLNFLCACHNPAFMIDAVNCMTTACTTGEKITGQTDLQDACRLVGTSVSGGPTSLSHSSTSISSGIPPVSPPGSSGTSSQATVTVTTTVSGSSPATTHPSSTATITVTSGGSTLTTTVLTSAAGASTSGAGTPSTVTTTSTRPAAPENGSTSTSAAGSSGTSDAVALHLELRGLAGALAAACIGVALGL